jgi:hypothetical protein
MEFNKIINILLILLILHCLLKSINIKFNINSNNTTEHFDTVDAFNDENVVSDDTHAFINKITGENLYNNVPSEELYSNISNKNMYNKVPSEDLLNPNNINDTIDEDLLNPNNINDTIDEELSIEQELYEHAIRNTNSLEEFTSNGNSIQSNTYLPNGLPNGNQLNNCNSIKPVNQFTSQYNIPNFSSECLNTDKFYSLKNDNHAYYYDDKGTKHNITQKNISNEPDTQWKYKNEIPMNGGNLFNNVYGVDVSDSGYAVFDIKNNNLNSKFYQQEQKHIQSGMSNKTIYN